jgi:O-antigen/teichoic acid export membrane protein
LDTLDLVVIAAFSTALTDPVVRHLHDARNPRDRERVISTAVLSLLVCGALIAVVGALASPAIAAWMLRDRSRADLVAYTLLSVTSQAVIEVPFAVMRYEEKRWSAAAWSLSRMVLGLVLNIALIVALKLGLKGMVLANLVASTALGVALVVRTLQRTGLAFERAALVRMLHFGAPLIPGALAMIALGHQRSYVLNAYTSLTVVGIWAFGYRFGAAVTYALGHPLRAAWSSRMYALWDTPDGPARYRNVGTWAVALYAWAAATLSTFAPELVHWMAPASFARAVAVVPAVAWSCALREVAEYFRSGLLLARNVRHLAWLEPLLALVDFALGLALIARFGLVGAIIASPVVYALYAFMMHAAVRRVLPVRYDYARMFLCATLAALASIAGHAAPLVLKPVVVAAYPIALVWLVLRSPEEREALRALRASLGRWYAR